MKKIALACSLLLAGCGIVPLPQQPLSDFDLSMPFSASAPTPVLYLKGDPQIQQGGPVQGVRVQYNVRYLPALLSSSRHGLAFYVRSALPGPQDTHCTDRGSYYECDPTREERVGSITLEQSQPNALTLAGAALDRAVRAKQGYVGLALEEGQIAPGDRLEFRNGTVNARF
ncbi:hypothetical protein HNR42_000251 [Deinobacterium chartae]|uniref:Lipoprotein n=1 Tax=Deinobacterium chartae TaxID=521158 RepID=A0A841HX67_9DEIO|nr:hypothetical protein [Deinobacterium chartae]MBB6096839.1 hypothetical protein [Deinobacterium chartae]